MSASKMRVFQIEIARQYDFAMLAESDLKRTFQNKTTIHSRTDLNICTEMNHFWYSAQSLLVAVANISKLLWPPSPRARREEDKEAFEAFKKRRMEEAKILREALNIDDSSPLKNRNLR